MYTDNLKKITEREKETNSMHFGLHYHNVTC